MTIDPWDAQLRLRAYSFFPQREQFISTYRRFDEWVCVVAESGRFGYEVDSSEPETGEAKVERGEAEFGDLVFARPGGLFNRHVLSAPLVYHVLQWSFIPEAGEYANQKFWQAGKWLVRDRTRLTSALGALRPLFGRSDSWSARRRQHLLEELLHLAWMGRQEAAIVDPLMNEAARLLREGATKPLPMSEIAGALGLGPVQLTRRFHAAFGKNPIEYLTEVRLEKAQQMLIETSATLDQIAARCGWASGAYLSTVFERHFQLTPGRFRKQHRV